MSGKCLVCRKWFLHGEIRIPVAGGLVHSFHKEISEQETGEKKSALSLPVNPKPAASSHSKQPVIAAYQERVRPEPVVHVPIQANWACLICGEETNPFGSLGCRACFTPRGLVRSVSDEMRMAERWTCRWCTHSNIGVSDHCAMCYLARDFDLALFPSVESEERWSCLICAVDGNHWLSSHCSVCGYDRGSAPEVDESFREVTQDVEFECERCYETKAINEKYRIGECSMSQCKECSARWIEVQINDGKSLALKCICNEHSVKYKDIRELRPYIAKSTMGRYEASQRRNQRPAGVVDGIGGYQGTTACQSIQALCPECNEAYDIWNGQISYQCRNTMCSIKEYPICCKHNVVYTRPKLDAERRCETCLDEAGGNATVARVVSSILDALCDKCPSCNAYVGEPESFDSCLCLRCSHCPNCFCGFCYRFASDWRSTHDHLHECPLNPRKNYFVESEAVWRELMRARKDRIIEAIISSSGVESYEAEMIRSRIQSSI